MGVMRKVLLFLDFGLYVENKTYVDVKPAILKQMNMQATQTHYVFQCGDVELLIDFCFTFLVGEMGYDRMACRFSFLSDSCKR